MTVRVIQLDIATRDRLKAIGKKGETYNDIISRLLEEHGKLPKLGNGETA